MRKLFALAMVAVLAMTVALAVLGCGKKEETSSSTTETSTTSMDSMGTMTTESTTTTTTDTTRH